MSSGDEQETFIMVITYLADVAWLNIQGGSWAPGKINLDHTTPTSLLRLDTPFWGFKGKLAGIAEAILGSPPCSLLTRVTGVGPFIMVVIYLPDVG